MRPRERWKRKWGAYRAWRGLLECLGGDEVQQRRLECLPHCLVLDPKTLWRAYRDRSRKERGTLRGYGRFFIHDMLEAARKQRAD